MRILDRYLLRNFLEPFLLCFFGFLSIWLIFDLGGNLSDFIEVGASIKVIAKFYLSQLPGIILISLPVGLLLALLFSLSRMSRSNEIISMLTAGRSVIRILAPLLCIGLLTSLGCLWLNYELAPRSEEGKRAALEQITKAAKKIDRTLVEGYLFRDRMNSRTWYVKRMHTNNLHLEGVHITQQNESGAIVRKWYANSADFDETSKSWILKGGAIVDFNSEGDIANTDYFPTALRTIASWTETPWRILSSHLEAQTLTVPLLRNYLRFNGDFPEAQLAPFRTYLWHRLALPWSCLVVVFIAAPLGIVYSRRGVLAGVASSIFIFFGMMFFTNLCLALGKGDRVPAVVAAWLPNVLFGFVGLVLLYFRSTNRDLPSFRLWKK